MGRSFSIVTLTQQGNIVAERFVIIIIIIIIIIIVIIIIANKCMKDHLLQKLGGPSPCCGTICSVFLNDEWFIKAYFGSLEFFSGLETDFGSFC